MNLKSLAGANSFKYIILLFSLFLFSYHVLDIQGMYFDESHYIPAAKEWINLEPSTEGNAEHPPLAKYFMAASIKVFGDNPLGWRTPSVISGSVAILLCFLISLLIFNDLTLSVTIAFFNLFNFFFFIHSRIAMLDIFMVTFLLAGIYYFLKYKYKSKDNLAFYLSSFFFGLAVATKWSTILVYLPFFIIIIASEIKKPYRKDLLVKDLLRFGSFGLLSVIIYYITFIPYLFVKTENITLFEVLFIIPIKMLKIMEGVGTGHAYATPWYTWPLMITADIYKFFFTVDEKSFKGILVVANPLQMVLGLISVIYLSLKWKQIRNLAKVTLILFLCSWVGWSLVPRTASYFFYFFPSAVSYSFLIPMALLDALQNHKKVAIIIMIAITLASAYFFVSYSDILSW